MGWIELRVIIWSFEIVWSILRPLGFSTGDNDKPATQFDYSAVRVFFSTEGLSRLIAQVVFFLNITACIWTLISHSSFLWVQQQQQQHTRAVKCGRKYWLAVTPLRHILLIILIFPGDHCCDIKWGFFQSKRIDRSDITYPTAFYCKMLQMRPRDMSATAPTPDTKYKKNEIYCRQSVCNVGSPRK